MAAFGQDRCLAQTLSGHWLRDVPYPVWQESSSDCQGSNGIDLAISHNYSVLFLGDSLDAHQLTDIYVAAQERGLATLNESHLLSYHSSESGGTHAYDSLITCRLPAGHLQFTGFKFGAWPFGPYWLSDSHSDTPSQVRLKQARSNFLEQ